MVVEQVEAPPQSTGLSVASMVLGIVGMVIPFVGIVCSPLALIFGAVQLRKHAGGKGMAVTGLVLGIVAVAIYLLVLVMVIVGANSGPQGG